MDKEQYEILYRVEEHHWWYRGMQRMVASLLHRYLDLSRRPRILDAGCGTGGMLKYLSHFGSVAGIDLAGEALALCQRRGISGLARADVDQLPFAGESFDLVVCFDVLYHADVEDDRQALAEFHRVLKPGGLMIIRVPAYNWLRGAHDVAVHTRHRYSRRELARKLGSRGFAIQKISYVNSLLFPLAALKRMAEGSTHAFGPDLQLPPAPVNRFLEGVLALESALLANFSFPWGLSLLAVVTKADS